MINKNWKTYKNKQVKLIVKDVPYPKTKTGIFIDIDETHIFLRVQGKAQPVPFERTDVKRVELMEGEGNEKEE